MAEFQVYGPAGTGKTTYLAKQVQRSANKFGSGSVMVASFTKTASQEIASRDLHVKRDNVGTLHALCYRALGSPPIASTMIDDWNKRNVSYQLSGGNRSLDETIEGTGGTEADGIYQQMEVLRAKQVPEKMFPARVRAFARRWRAWKEEHGAFDFTDMIETALTDTDTAPNRPLIGFFDEAQDFTPLELALIRKWGESMSQIVLAGDDDQSIYAFKGADPSVLIDGGVPEENKRVLSRSFRLPKAVYDLAERWIQRVERRQPKNYAPRDEAGEVRRLYRANFRLPEEIIKDMDQYVEQGKTVMVLASCSYMIDPLKKELRARGYPFHNPYRLTRGDWNPLRIKRDLDDEQQVSTIDRMFRYLKARDEYSLTGQGSMWTMEDLKLWVELVRAKGVLERGAKAQIQMTNPDNIDIISVKDLQDYFTAEGLDGALTVDPNWLYTHSTSSKKKVLEYPVRVLDNQGVKAFKEKPSITIGTIHSVKGGEADVVYLIPDLSSAGMMEWLGRREKRDSIIRQFYVGITRTRESLVLCGQATGNAVKIR